MLVTLITPTGSRSEAFALCEYYVSRELHPNQIEYQWIVVDDSPGAPTNCTLGQEHYFSSLAWEPGINTQRYNLDEALKHIRGDVIFVVEDDDYYSAGYFTSYISLLQQVPIVGLSNSRYYNLSIPGWREMSNYTHASLCHTAFRKELLPMFRQAIHSGSYYFDMELWKAVQAKRVPNILIANSSIAIGMKGLPGRGGLGVGHVRKDYYLDSDLAKLREWLGEDSDLYTGFIKNEGLDANTQEQAGSLRESYRRMSQLR